jgi:hypothetical protein
MTLLPGRMRRSRRIWGAYGERPEHEPCCTWWSHTLGRQCRWRASWSPPWSSGVFIPGVVDSGQGNDADRLAAAAEEVEAAAGPGLDEAAFRRRFAHLFHDADAA